MKKVLESKLDLLNEETDRIFESIASLDENSLQNTGNGWSVIQVLNHLQMAEGASLSYMKKKLLAGDKMGKIKSVYGLKMRVTKAALNSGLKWRAPTQISNPEGSFSLEEVRTSWKNLRLDLKKYVDEYPEKWLDRAVYKHPMAGRQGLGAAVDSFIYHQRHHVHQIRRIRKKIAA